MAIRPTYAGGKVGQMVVHHGARTKPDKVQGATALAEQIEESEKGLDRGKVFLSLNNIKIGEKQKVSATIFDKPPAWTSAVGTTHTTDATIQKPEPDAPYIVDMGRHGRFQVTDIHSWVNAKGEARRGPGFILNNKALKRFKE